MNELVMKTQNLTRDFGAVRAVDGVNMEVPAVREAGPPGQVVALLGPNGAGKTTLLKLALGLLEPTAGQIQVLGRPSRRLPASVRRRIISVGENHDPPPWATVRRMIHLQAGASPNFDGELAQALCRERGLPLNKPLGSLSKGQKRWVLAALALASGAELLLMDEPADGLDPAARRSLYDQIRDYVNDNWATAIIATHIIGDIERVADDVAIIDHGRLVLHESLEGLREEVRELEFIGVQEAPHLGEGVETIASTQVEGAALSWARGSAECLTAMESRLGPQATVRTVGLEALYLAITGSAGRGAAQMKEAS